MVEAVGDVRQNLDTHVARFRAQGVDAEPVVFGDQMQPEAVLVPYATFQLLADVVEDLTIAETVRERLESDTGDRTSLGDVADELGVDLDRL